MKNIVFSVLFCLSQAVGHSEELTRDQQIAQVRKLIAFRNALFCREKEIAFELAPCRHTVDQLYDLVFGRTTSLIPMVPLQDSDDFHRWLSQQENTLLMVSKPGCIPCAQAHAFISEYLDQHRLTTSVVGIEIEQAHFLADQGALELKNITGTPEFFMIEKGKVVQVVHGLDGQALRKHIAQNLA